MTMRRQLLRLVVILIVWLSSALPVFGGLPTCQYDYNGDGDIDGSDLIRFAAEFDGLDLDFFAGKFGSPACQPIPGVPADVDLGVSFDEQQGGGGLVGETVRILNGNIFIARIDLSFTSPHSMGLGFSAYYNSQSSAAGSTGVGWSHTYSVLLNPGFNFDNQTYIRIVDDTGLGHYFLEDSPELFMGAFHERSHVTVETDGFIWQRLNGSRYGFS